jgi:hypothetical protein
MLKRVFLNNRKIPVPIPVKTLADALQFVEKTLVPEGHTVTRVVLDGRTLSDELIHECRATALGDETRLEVQVDSPSDLAVQTLDALRNLALVIGSGLKALAVECWQAKGATRPAELAAVASDLKLILDLIDHLSGLVDASHIDAAAIQGLSGMVQRVHGSLDLARGNSDWRGSARILLNRLEPLLKDLVAEAESLQIRIMTAPTATRSPSARAPTG